MLSGGLRGADLPGGADLGDHPYAVTIELADVVDLVPQSLVKVDDVPVGAVSAIAVDPATWNARVTVEVNGDVTLPANATARVRTTSLLGEKFVELAAPAQGATGTLAPGAVIPLARSGRAAEVEEVLGSLSMLLNGGGVAQIRTISTELNHALAGNEPQVRALLANLNTLVGALDSRKGEITRALDGINRLSATLAAAPRRDHHRARRPRSPGSPSWTASAASWWTCCSRSTGSPGSRRTSSTRAATTSSPTCARCSPRCEARRLRPEPAQLAADLRQLPVHRRRTGRPWRATTRTST